MTSYCRCRPPVGSDKREIRGTNRCTARNYPCTGHCVAVLGPGAGIPANRQRCEENGAVECMAELGSISAVADDLGEPHPSPCMLAADQPSFSLRLRPP